MRWGGICQHFLHSITTVKCQKVISIATDKRNSLILLEKKLLNTVMLACCNLGDESSRKELPGTVNAAFILLQSLHVFKNSWVSLVIYLRFLKCVCVSKIWAFSRQLNSFMSFNTISLIQRKMLTQMIQAICPLCTTSAAQSFPVSFSR